MFLDFFSNHLPAKLPVTSAPLHAWNPGRAAVLAGSRAFTIGPSLVFWERSPLPVTNAVFSHSCGYRRRAKTKTSVSGDTISMQVAPEDVASTACNNSFVSASACVLSRWIILRWVASHWLPHAITTCFLFSCPICNTFLARYWVSPDFVLTWDRSLLRFLE